MDLHAELEIIGRLRGSSNYSLLARLKSESGEAIEDLAVYKPQRGEAPLWDFPEGTLCQREVAAYTVAEAAGWHFVPPTILRDGPLGPGAVQLFIEHDPSITAFELPMSFEEDLRTFALFDLVINNADRKAGHVLMDSSKKLWGVDHGLCFHEEPKLRTVLWDFIGQPFSEPHLEALADLRRNETLQQQLAELLAPPEVEAFKARIDEALSRPEFPPPTTDRPYPWPPV